MTRYKATAQGNVPLTPEEEAQRDAEELAWANGVKDRQRAAIQKQIDAIETTDRAVRELLLTACDPDEIAYKKLEEKDDAIALLREQLNSIV
jgi:hypothetical protein